MCGGLAVGVSLLVLTASLFPICMMLLRTVSGFLTFVLLIGRCPYGSMDAAYKIVLYTMAGSLVLLPSAFMML